MRPTSVPGRRGLCTGGTYLLLLRRLLLALFLVGSVAEASHTEVIRDENGKEVHIFVCSENHYTDSCSDNSGRVYIDREKDGGT